MTSAAILKYLPRVMFCNSINFAALSFDTVIFLQLRVTMIPILRSILTTTMKQTHTDIGVTYGKGRLHRDRKIC